MDTGRKGLCTTTNVTDSTPCSADNAGNPVTAIPGSCKNPGCEAGQSEPAGDKWTDAGRTVKVVGAAEMEVSDLYGKLG